MKKLVLVFVFIFSLNSLFSQECSKKCDKANKYVMSNGLIKATLYHDNGKIAQTGFYTQENKLQNEWISYDANGNRTAVGQYDNGIKVGTWIFYQGNTQKEVVYNDSKIAQVKTWEVTDTRVVANRR